MLLRHLALATAALALPLAAHAQPGAPDCPPGSTAYYCKAPATAPDGSERLLVHQDGGDRTMTTAQLEQVFGNTTLTIGGATKQIAAWLALALNPSGGTFAINDTTGSIPINDTTGKSVVNP